MGFVRNSKDFMYNVQQDWLGHGNLRRVVNVFNQQVEKFEQN